MDDQQEAGEETAIRKTRSGRRVKTPAISAPAPKHSPRKTRKKMVLVEVEVSEDEEAAAAPELVTNPDPEPYSDEVVTNVLNDQKTEVSSTDDENVDQNGHEALQIESEIEEHNGNTDLDTELAADNDKIETDELSSEIADCTDDPTSSPEKIVDNTEMTEEAMNLYEDSSSNDKEMQSKYNEPLEDGIEENPEEQIENIQDQIENTQDQEDDTEQFKEDNVESIDDQVENLQNEEWEKAPEVEDKIVENINESEESTVKTIDEPMEIDEVKDTVEKVEQNNDEREDSIDGQESEVKVSADPDAENISEDELPGVQVAKVPETEEVSDDELPGPKRAELPADTEVVSEDELPTVKKEPVKRKLQEEGDYDPCSPTSETEGPVPKKILLEAEAEKEKEEKKPKKLPELDKYWKAVNDDPSDFTGWTYLLQYVDQENDMEAAREAYDAFLSHYPYCYGYWRKYADYEKRKGNKKKCEEVFERGLKAIPLSVDLWIHYLTYVRTTRPDDEEFVRSQFERAIVACGIEFRSDRLWDSYIKWETEDKRLQQVTVIYDRLLATPTQGYTTHFDNFQEHITTNPPNKVLEVDEFLALRKEVKHMLKHDVTTETTEADNPDVPPGEDDVKESVSSDEETKAIRERIISIRRKIHKGTVTAVTQRWNFEEGIKRPYFHVKPLERCQLKNWQEYLDYEIAQGDQNRIIILFERCLIACALYEEFWLRFVHYLEGLKDTKLQSKIKDVYERACTIHHLKKPSLHLQWAMFEESIKNFNKAAEILTNLEKVVPNILQVAYRRINLERRREDYEKCSQLYEQYIQNSKNKLISSNLSIKYSRFTLKVMQNMDKAIEIINTAISKDPSNSRLYLQLIDLTLHKEGVQEEEVVKCIDLLLEKDSIDIDQKTLFSQRKLEFLEDFGSNIQNVQIAYEEYQKYFKLSKENKKKEVSKGVEVSAAQKDKVPKPPSVQSNSYNNYGNYGNAGAGSYQYSGSQQNQYHYSQYGQGDQYQYGNWQYPQGGYGGYNQWGGYGGGYGY